jgi:hypothetical protein
VRAEAGGSAAATQGAPATDSALEFVARARAARCNARVDAATARVLSALAADGVRAILLKGPALARWLYADGTPRPYVDADLLVDPRRVIDAERCLGRLGFAKVCGPEDMPGWYPPESEWTGSGEGEVIDLHWGLGGAGASDDVVWAALSVNTERLVVAGVEVQALGRPALALHVALHAAKHATLPKPRVDLARALHAADRGTWEAAAALAWRLGAQDMFVAGLRLEPAGARLAAWLGMTGNASATSILMATSAAPGALALEAFATATLRTRVWLALRTLIPTRRWMIMHTARGGRGGAWLAASYAWHPIAVTLRAGPAWRAWRRARAASRASQALVS